MTGNTFRQLFEACKAGLKDGLYVHEVIDHLVVNEGLTLEAARRVAFYASRVAGQVA